jgi:hypothetical protein
VGLERQGIGYRVEGLANDNPAPLDPLP